MILSKYPEANKTIEQIVAAHPKGYNHNCAYGKRCKAYRIPITSTLLSDLNWYIQLDKKIKSMRLMAVDCEGTTETMVPDYHIAGQDGDGNHYIVLNSLEALPSLTTYQMWFEATYVDNSKQSFFSEEYEIVLCDVVDIVYSCYNESDNGGYDMNGAWIGYANNPYKVDNTGNVQIRYFNNYIIRDLKVLYSGSQMTFTAFNSRAVKTDRVKTYSIHTEVMPYWYEEMVSSAFAKGYVFIDGSYWSISDYSSTPVGDSCCERLTLDIIAKKEDSVAMSCSTSCNYDQIILPDCSLGRLSYTITTIEGDCSLGSLSQTCLNC